MKVTLEQVYWFHGHTCPMSTLGYRARKLAKKLLKLKRKDYRIAVVKLYFKSCAIDGIQISFPSTYGNNNLIVYDEKNMRFEFIRADNNSKIVVSFTQQLMDLMNNFLLLRKEAEEIKNRALFKKMDSAYKKFLKFTQTSKDEELFVIESYV